MRRLLTIAVLALAFAVASTAAQAQAARPTQSGAPTVGAQPKEPGTATLISVVLPGGGQMWSGDLNRGLKILAAAWGVPTVGMIVGTTACASASSGCGVGAAVYGLSALVGLGAWVYGVVDAAPTARRMNAANGFASISPTVTQLADGRQGFGLRVTF